MVTYIIQYVDNRGHRHTCTAKFNNFTRIVEMLRDFDFSL